MALTNCPECNKQISDVAPNCPNCGFPLRKQNFEIKPTPQNQNNNPNYTRQNTPPITPKPVGCLKIVSIIILGSLGIYLIGIILFAFLGPNKEETESKRIEKETKAATEEKEQIKKDSIAKIELVNNLPNDIQKTIEDINEVEFDKFRGSVDNLILELNLFNEWRKLIEETEEISSEGTEEAKQMAQKLKKTVQNIQAKEFPILRKEYLKEAKKTMWEHDIDVFGTSNNTHINFTGGTFAANKNIKTFQEEIDYILENFRFKQANYRWYKGASEYSYYAPFKGKDTDLFEIRIKQ